MSFWLPPETVGQKVLRWALHFALGFIFGSLPAVMALAIVSGSPGVNLARAAMLVVLFFCLPGGLLFWLVGLVDRGRLLHGLLRILGTKTDPSNGP